MSKRRKISLILTMVLSFAIFAQNIQAIRVVRAEEVGDEDSVDEELTAAPPEQAPEEESEPAPAPQQAPEPSDDDDDRQEAMEKAGEENMEEQKKSQQGEGAQAALDLADKKNQAGENAAAEGGNGTGLLTYKLVASTASISFGEDPVGTDRNAQSLMITNASSGEVDFTFHFASRTGAFGCDLSTGNATGNSYHLAKNGSATFSVSMRNDLSPGNYSDALVFTIANEGVSTTPLKVNVTGAVSGSQKVIKSVTVSPQNYKLTVGDKYQFTAEVRDNDGNVKDVDQSVDWEVRGAKSASTDISSDGVLSIASDESSTGLVVYAFSNAAPSIYGTSNVTPKKGGFNVSVAADPKEGGSVTGGGSVVQGGSVTLTAIPNSNYSFAGWVRDGKVVSTATNYKISNIQSSFGVTAKFDRKYVKVELEKNNDAGGKVSGGGKIKYGESTTITAKANDGYVFTGWKEDGKIISKDATHKLKDLKEDRKIKGMFEKTSHTITLCASPAEGGTVSGGGTFAINQGTTVKAVPNTGYSFVGWEVNGQIVNRDATVKIDKLEQDYKCTAIFIKTGVTTFEISAGVATTGGSISPSGKRVVAQGQNITYTITPKAGFAVLAVAVDGNQVGPVNTYTFSNVQGNHTIAAAFLLTDAGKAQAAAAGQSVQENKVQAVERNASNTASAESTVSLEDALLGDGGDDYVEKMDDLDSITIPTDEELGISEDDYSYSDVASILGKTQEEARAMAEAGNKSEISRAAFYAGALGADAENQLEPANMNGVDYSSLTTEELMQLPEEDIYPSYLNLDVVVENLLSTEDLIVLVDGGTENVSVSLTKMGEYDIAPADEKIIKSAVGKKPLQLFDLSMMKTVDGYTENVHEIDEALEIVIEVPDEIYKEGVTYSVLRVHKGELKVLPDLDDDPKTITFRTDRFSSYAIAQDVASTREMLMYLSLGALAALLVGLSCLLILLLHQARMRKMRRLARAEQRKKEI